MAGGGGGYATTAVKPDLIRMDRPVGAAGNASQEFAAVEDGCP